MKPQFKDLKFQSNEELSKWLNETASVIIHFEDKGQDMQLMHVHSSGEILDCDYNKSIYVGKFVGMIYLAKNEPVMIYSEELEGYVPKYGLIIEDIEILKERKCRICGCTEDDCHQCIEKTGSACIWVEWDLCSACVEESLLEKKYTELLINVATNDFYTKIDLSNRTNCYKCDCGHITKTKDVDAGVTPFMCECEKCGLMARSTFYKDIVPDQKPTKEWYRPTLQQVLKMKHNKAMLEHIFQGGLDIRDVTESKA